MKIDVVLNKLNENPNLTEEVKKDIQKLLESFNGMFPNYDYTNTADLFSTVKISKASKFICRSIVNYDIENNSLNLNISEVKENDAENAMMFGILEILSSKKQSTDSEKAFRSGMNTMIATNLVGNSENYMICEDEYITINLLSDIVGLDTVFNAYESKNMGIIAQGLEQSGNDIKTINSLFSGMGHNYVCHTVNDGGSNLTHIQAKIIEMFFSNPDLEVDKINDFKGKLITNPDYFKKPFAYSELGRVETYFNIKSEQYLLSKQQNVGMVR